MITIRSLKKNYGKTQALAGIDMDIDAGECYGLIGPNGAGKTTTLKTLATLLKPDYGVAFVDGIDVVDRPDLVRGIVGFMPDVLQSYGDVKILHYLDYFASMVGLRGRERTRQVSQVLDLVDLMPKRDEVVGGLSRGNKQRLSLAKTLLHNPRVLLLDEPASGLDPRARIEIRLLLKELKTLGKTIIISSHILEDLQEICDRLAIYEAGHVIRRGGVAELVAAVRSARRLLIRTKAAAADAVDILKALDVVAELELMGPNQLGLHLKDNDTMPVLEALVANKIKIESFVEERPALADVFLDLTRGEVS